MDSASQSYHDTVNVSKIKLTNHEYYIVHWKVVEIMQSWTSSFEILSVITRLGECYTSSCAQKNF